MTVASQDQPPASGDTSLEARTQKADKPWLAGFFIVIALLTLGFANVACEGTLYGHECRTDSHCSSDRFCDKGWCKARPPSCTRDGDCKEPGTPGCAQGKCLLMEPSPEPPDEQTPEPDGGPIPEPLEICPSNLQLSPQGGRVGKITQSTEVFDIKRGQDGSLYLTGTQGQDLFLIKINPDQKLEWTFLSDSSLPGASEQSTGRKLAIDSQKNIIVVGEHGHLHTFEKKTLPYTKGDRNILLAKFSPAGKLLWASSAGGSLGDDGTGVLLGPKDEIYISGNFRGTGVFPATGSRVSFSDLGLKTAFVAKFSSDDGTLSWLKKSSFKKPYEGKGLALSLGLAAGVEGEMYANGFFSNQVYFGEHSLTKNTGLSASFVNDGFVVRLNKEGEYLWARGVFHQQPSGYARVQYIATDPTSGDVYIAADLTDPQKGPTKVGFKSFSSGGFYVAKLNRKGDWLWSQAFGPSRYSKIKDIATGPDGSLYITGHYISAQLSLGRYTLPSQGSERAFLAKLNPKGVVMWAIQSHNKGAQNHAQGSCLLLAPPHIIWGGSFTGSLQLGSALFQALGDLDAFFIYVHEPLGCLP